MSTRRRTLSGLGAGVAGALAAGGLGPFAAGDARAAVPQQGPLWPEVYRFRLGAFEITCLLDGKIAMDGPHPIFGQDRTPEEVAELCRANFLPGNRFVNGFTPLLVNTGREVVLIDTGNGAARRPQAGRLRELLGRLGIAPGQVDVVPITHFHPDHIGGLMEDGAPAFPNARIFAGRVEYEFWTAEERLSGPTENTAKLVRANVVPLSERITFLEDGQEVVPGITAMAAFGHTPGHLVFHIESEGRRLLMWADTANHYVVSVQRPDWHVRFDMDKQAAAATRRRIFDMCAAERLPVAGYHMPFPALGFVERTAESWRFLPATYQFEV